MGNNKDPSTDHCRTLYDTDMQEDFVSCILVHCCPLL